MGEGPRILGAWDELGGGRISDGRSLPGSLPQINADIRRSGMESTGLMGDRGKDES